MVFIDASKGKYPFFLKEALRLLAPNGIIFADNVLYKGYVLSDYNKHKQRTAVKKFKRILKELNELQENKQFDIKVFRSRRWLSNSQKNVRKETPENITSLGFLVPMT